MIKKTSNPIVKEPVNVSLQNLDARFAYRSSRSCVLPYLSYKEAKMLLAVLW